MLIGKYSQPLELPVRIPTSILQALGDALISAEEGVLGT